jgi:hypothetical protein
VVEKSGGYNLKLRMAVGKISRGFVGQMDTVDRDWICLCFSRLSRMGDGLRVSCSFLLWMVNLRYSA